MGHRLEHLTVDPRAAYDQQGNGSAAAKVTGSGELVRLRFDHSFGKSPLEIGRVNIGRRLRRALRRHDHDGVIDFDRVVRDPANTDFIHPSFDYDGIHPTPRGYYEMGRSVGPELFRR